MERVSMIPKMYSLYYPDEAVCASVGVVRYIPRWIRDELRSRALWDDMMSEVLSTILEYVPDCYSPTFQYRALHRHAQRKLYSFLKSVGYRKVRKDGKVIWVRDLSLTAGDDNDFYSVLAEKEG